MFILFLFSIALTTVRAQITLPKTNAGSVLKDFVKPPAIGDVGSTSKGITEMLGSKLSLPEAQKPKVLEAVTGFLNQKKGIMDLANTNPTDYLSKFNPLQKGLFGKLKGIMGAAAFTKFMGLKPSGANAAKSALGNLFF